MIEIPYIEINQPIGSFYITKISADVLINLVNITPRDASNPNAIQREQSNRRINEISNYCSDPDAIFPTPIIISIYEDADIVRNKYTFSLNHSHIDKIGEVIDGQHRLKGIEKSSYSHKFDLPVVLMFDLTEEEKAYIFSIINSKQTKVSTSLIYDLFALSEHRSPQKTAHEIARAMNNNPQSPFYNRLKMLGKKEKEQDEATLSQGTFVKHLIELISKKPDEDYLDSKKEISFKENKELPLREYFIKDKDEIILKILLNLFRSLKDSFPNYWENPKENILWKTTGYIAVIKSFNYIYKIGDDQNDLSYDFFKKLFDNFKKYLDIKNIKLTSEYFPSNAQQQIKLRDMIIESTKKPH